MRLAPGVRPLVALSALGAVGLLAPGVPGVVGAFTWLGVFPGLALARLVLPRAGATTRWTLGLALSPLASALAGVALLAAGQPLATAAHLIAVGGWLLFAGGEARALGRVPADPDDRPLDRVAWAWVLGACAVVALPLLDPWIRVRSDTWTHAGIMWEIVTRGIPPQDPRFAGLTLNYVWFYNLFLALLTGLRGQDPFAFIAVANVVWMGVQIALVWQLAWGVWGGARAARGTLALWTLGFNAGALLLWPLGFVRALVGSTRGLADVRNVLAGTSLGSTDVLYTLSAPFAWMVNFWDKYTIGTALGYGYLLALVLLWALVRHLGTTGAPGSGRWLVVAALATAGAMLFHSVVGLTVTPVTVGACALAMLLAARRRWPGKPAAPAAFAAATLAGFAPTLPYFRSLITGWSPEHSGLHLHYLKVSWQMPWTLVTACGVAAACAWVGTRRAVEERRAAPALLALWAVCMTAFALVVHLPGNNETKFVFLVFAALALLGGPVFPDALAAARRRLPGAAFTTLFAGAFVVPTVLFLVGYLADPAARTAPALHPAPGEAALYAWIRERTDPRAVFVDRGERALVMVTGRRRLFDGTTGEPEKSAFPVSALRQRREVCADLYGPVAHLADDARVLAGVGAPLYVLYRAADFPDGARPWAALAADTARFEPAYVSPGFRVYRLRPGA